MNETQKQGFSLAGIKSKTWLAKELAMTRATLLDRLYGITEFNLSEADKINQLYNQLTTK